MNKKMVLCGVVAVFLTVDAYAKAKTAPASSGSMPLKELLLFFADSQQTDADLTRYLSIKGIRWKYKEIKDKSDIYNTGRIKLRILKYNEITVSGWDGRIQSVNLSSSQPNKQFKRVLEANLGKDAIVKEMIGCRDGTFRSPKAYTVNFEGKPVIYVNTEANFSFEPYMSPLYTYFEFTLTRPSDWKC